MVNGKEAMVQEFVLHRIGASEAESVISDHSAVLEGMEEQEFLRKLLLRPFSTAVHTCEFDHKKGAGKGVLHKLCTDVEDGEDLVAVSAGIARHLLRAAEQHTVRGGDLFVVKFSGVELGNAAYNGVGIYKFDDKEVFIESAAKGGAIAMKLRRGLGTIKPSKACLVLFTDDDCTLFTIDGPGDTGFWQRDFIGLRAKRDHVNSTSNVLDLTKSFITEQLPQDYEIAKADQIDLLNRSVQYFKSHSEFDKDEFAKEVFQDEGAIRSFDRYSHRFQEEHAVELEDGFEISPQAVKRQARVFKSVLKLDKNFHIY
ncbi:MAG: nucleoid-associated protein, partial [Flavobacteriales bacterium]|nr:nucleoid-associated protein [Flavobacteriales bacterium]